MAMLCRAFFSSVLLAAVAQGSEGVAPLETSRQELRKLQGGQKTGEAPGAKDALRPSLPTLVTPGQEPLPAPELLSPEKLEKERKLQREREARKNWLVNGVQQLEKSDKARERSGSPETDNLSKAENPQTDEGRDPQYLLKLYDEQKKIETERQTDAKVQRGAAADPLAPFLQGWLGSSPARGRFFDEFARKSEGGSAGALPISGPAASSAGYTTQPLGGFSGPVTDPATKASNPYLADLSPIRNSQPAPALATAGTLSPAGANPTFAPPVVAAPPSPAEVRQPEKKAPSPPQADDKKYFPQLNRF